jgi:exoribonuclease R
MEEVQTIPEGPCRAIALRRFLGRAGMSFMKPMSHGGLGIPGYVQFTSPIRRYGDLLAHYQVSPRAPLYITNTYVACIPSIMN